MSNQTQAVAPTNNQKAVTVTLKSSLESPAYQDRFRQILKDRTPEFCASIIQVYNGTKALKECDPHSIIASAMTAAILGLPIEKNLGFAHLVPYKGQCTFIVGYKGYVQLALRTGQYKRMNATTINGEAFGGYDSVGEPIIKWENLDHSKPVSGYVFAFQTITGFEKVVYWTKERANAHGLKYSASYRGGYDSVWKSNPDAMGIKTAVREGLSKWGIMSVQLQRALTEDNGARSTVDADIEYPDNEPTEPVKGKIGAINVDATVVGPGDPAQAQAQSEQAKPKGRPAGSKNKPKEQPAVDVQATVTVQPEAQTAAATTAKPPKQESSQPAQPATQPVVPTEPSKDPLQALKDIVKANNLPEEKFCAWVTLAYRVPGNTIDAIYEASPSRAFKIYQEWSTHWPAIEKACK